MQIVDKNPERKIFQGKEHSTGLMQKRVPTKREMITRIEERRAKQGYINKALIQ